MKLFEDEESFLGFWGEALMQASGARLFIEGMKDDPAEPEDEAPPNTGQRNDHGGSALRPEYEYDLC